MLRGMFVTVVEQFIEHNPSRWIDALWLLNKEATLQCSNQPP